MQKAVIFLQEDRGQEAICGLSDLFEDDALCSGLFIEEVSVWSDKFGPHPLETAPWGLTRGDRIYTDSFQVFGRTQEVVCSTLQEIVFRWSIKVFMIGGLGLMEITPEAVEAILQFGALDVRIILSAA